MLLRSRLIRLLWSIEGIDKIPGPRALLGRPLIVYWTRLLFRCVCDSVRLFGGVKRQIFNCEIADH